jgi:predicted aspartyl protease
MRIPRVIEENYIHSLGLPWRTRGSVVLANGAVDQFDIYAATVTWDGESRNILVEEADTEPLVGMALLRGYALSVQIVPGGTVTIAALSRHDGNDF